MRKTDEARSLGGAEGDGERKDMVSMSDDRQGRTPTTGVTPSPGELLYGALYADAPLHGGRVTRATKDVVKKAVAYLRNSSGAGDSSFERQRDLIAGAASVFGHELIMEFGDPDTPGSIIERQGFKQLIAYVSGSGVQAVWFEDITRLARSVRAAMALGNQLLELEVEIYSSEDGLVEHEQLLTKLTEAVIERRRLVRRCKKGLELAVRNKGISINRGGYGFEFRIVDGKRRQVLIAECIVVIQWIFDRFIEGWPPTAIVRELNRKGIKFFSRINRSPPREWKRADILANPSWGWDGMIVNSNYCGVQTLGRRTHVTTNGVLRKVPKRPAEMVVGPRLDQYAAISMETFAKAWQRAEGLMAIYKREKEMMQGVRGPYKVEGNDLLYDKLRCARCGGRMHMNSGTQIVLKCNRETCTRQSRIPQWTVNEILAEALTADLVSSELLDDFMSARSNEAQTADERTERQRDALEQELADLRETKIGAVGSKRYARYSDDEFDLIVSGWDERIAALEEELSGMASARPVVPLKDVADPARYVLETVSALIERASAGIAGDEDAVAAVRDLVYCVEVDNDPDRGPNAGRMRIGISPGGHAEAPDISSSDIIWIDLEYDRARSFRGSETMRRQVAEFIRTGDHLVPDHIWSDIERCFVESLVASDGDPKSVFETLLLRARYGVNVESLPDSYGDREILYKRMNRMRQHRRFGEAIAILADRAPNLLAGLSGTFFPIVWFPKSELPPERVRDLRIMVQERRHCVPEARKTRIERNWPEALRLDLETHGAVPWLEITNLLVTQGISLRDLPGRLGHPDRWVRTWKRLRETRLVDEIEALGAHRFPEKLRALTAPDMRERLDGLADEWETDALAVNVAAKPEQLQLVNEAERLHREEGLTWDEVATRMGVSVSWLHALRKEYGFIRTRADRPSLMLRATEMRQKGLTLTRIAANLNVSTKTVQRLLKTARG